MTSIPKSLRTALSEGNVIPFVGAGVSMNVRTRGPAAKPVFPSWTGLFERAEQRLRDEGTEDKIRSADDIKHHLAVSAEARDFLKLAEIAERSLGSLWLPFLRDVFDHEEAEIDPTSLMLPQEIWKLGSRLLITTNFDRVLQWACPNKGSSIVQNSQDSSFSKIRKYLYRPSNRSVWHLHGHIDDDKGLILSAKRYNDLYDSIDKASVRDQQTGRFAALDTLSDIVVSRSILFIGFSLEDPYFRQLMQWVQRAYGSATSTHYILVRERDLPRIKELLRDFTPCPIQPLTFADFGEPMLSLVRELSAHVPSAAEAPTSAVNGQAPSVASLPERSRLPILNSGQYARAYSAARSAVESLATLGDQLRWHSVQERTEELRATLSEDLYRVAVTGKSRAGKSTLLNAIIGRVVCPSKRLRTTAAPIVIGPGVDEWATIQIKSQKSVQIDPPITAEKLAPYADQEQNPDNNKNVLRINIRLSNQFLDMGVEYIDIPGFDDPNDDINKRTEYYIKLAHALIVVIDVAPYKSGSFTVDHQLARFLSQVIAQNRAVLVVCNKADYLDQQERTEVAANIRSELRRQGCPDPDRVPLFLLSASQACEARLRGQALPEDFLLFAESLWSKLWQTEAIGLRRLYRVFEQLRIASEEVSSLIAVRQMQEPDRVRLREAVMRCKKTKADLREQVRAACEAKRTQLGSKVSTIQSDLQRKLRAFIQEESASRRLPRKSAVFDAMKPHLTTYFRALVEEVAPWAQSQRVHVESVLAASLLELRAQAGLPQSAQQLKAQMSDLPGWQSVVELPLTMNWEHLLGLGAAGALTWLLAAAAVLATGGPGGFAFALGGLISSAVTWITDLVTDQANAEEKLVEECLARTTERIETLHQRLDQALAEVEEKLLNRINSRLRVFVEDMEDRLADIRLPTAEEQKLHQHLEAQIRHALEEFTRTFSTEAAVNRHGSDGSAPLNS